MTGACALRQVKRLKRSVTCVLQLSRQQKQRKEDRPALALCSGDGLLEEPGPLMHTGTLCFLFPLNVPVRVLGAKWHEHDTTLIDCSCQQCHIQVPVDEVRQLMGSARVETNRKPQEKCSAWTASLALLATMRNEEVAPNAVSCTSDPETPRIPNMWSCKMARVVSSGPSGSAAMASCSKAGRLKESLALLESMEARVMLSHACLRSRILRAGRHVLA